MNYIKKLIFFTLFMPFFSNAQNYQPGTVVNLKGDTLHGFINYHEWEGAPKSISFKADSNKTPVKFSANDIKYFNVSVGHLEEFRRYQGGVTTDKTDIDHLYVGKDTSFRIDTVFLRIIQKGKNITLYSYTDNIKTRYFISQNTSAEPQELIYRIYFNDGGNKNGMGRTGYDRTYMKQLVAISERLNDPALTEMIYKAEYSETDLLNITGKINGMSDKELSKTPRLHHKALKLVIFMVAFLTFYFTVHLK